jgi:c(7)-type cytochrome triheme protein
MMRPGLILVALLLAGCNTTPPQPAPAVARETPPTVATVDAPTTSVRSPPPPTEIVAPSARVTDSEPTILITGKRLTTTQINASESPRDDGIHDSTNDAIVVLQDPTVAMADFPRDRRHQVDWVQALEAGLIEPRADLPGEGEIELLDLDIMMKNTQFMPWVKFPHRAHTQWLACSNCHPAIFKPKKGANPISMNKVLRGEYCGVCHDKVAFALFTCERCHSVPHPGSGPKWW